MDSADDMLAWAEVWKVDEVIEAIEYTKSGITTERWHEIEAKLLRLAPDAYMGHGVTLDRIWPELTEAERAEIYNAWKTDYWPDGFK